MVIENEEANESQQDEPTKKAGRAGRKMAHKLEEAEQELMTTAESFRDRAAKALREGEIDLKEMLQVATDWVVENPRMAIGVLFGSGAFFGLLSSTRFGRALLIGGLAMASRRLV